MSNKFQPGDIVYRVDDFNKEEPLIVKEYEYLPFGGTKFVDTDFVFCIAKDKKGKKTKVKYDQHLLTK